MDPIDICKDSVLTEKLLLCIKNRNSQQIFTDTSTSNTDCKNLQKYKNVRHFGELFSKWVYDLICSVTRGSTTKSIKKTSQSGMCDIQ